MKRGSLFTENDKYLDTNFRHFLMTPMSLFLVSDPHFCDKRICNKVKWLPLLFSNQSALEIGVTLKYKKTKTFALKMFEVKNGQSAQYPLTSCVFFGQQWLCRCIFLLSFFFLDHCTFCIWEFATITLTPGFSRGLRFLLTCKYFDNHFVFTWRTTNTVQNT